MLIPITVIKIYSKTITFLLFFKFILYSVLNIGYKLGVSMIFC